MYVLFLFNSSAGYVVNWFKEIFFNWVLNTSILILVHTLHIIMYLTTIYIVSWARMDSLDFGTDFNCCHHHINHVFELLIFPNILFAKFKCLSLIATCYKHTRINICSRVILFFKKSSDLLIQLSKFEHLHKTKDNVFKIGLSFSKKVLKPNQILQNR